MQGPKRYDSKYGGYHRDHAYGLGHSPVDQLMSGTCDLVLGFLLPQQAYQLQPCPFDLMIDDCCTGETGHGLLDWLASCCNIRHIPAAGSCVAWVQQDRQAVAEHALPGDVGSRTLAVQAGQATGEIRPVRKLKEDVLKLEPGGEQCLERRGLGSDASTRLPAAALIWTYPFRRRCP
jgi:hypothetical protein